MTMPAERGPNGPSDSQSGRPHDRNEQTRRIDRRGLANGVTGVGAPVPSPAMDAATANPRIVTQHYSSASHSSSVARDERTQLAGSRKSTAADSSQTDNPADNPVVGWLVVIEGPGRGQARAIGYGMNGIGRGPDQRVSLDFGDEQISRHNHAALTYDPRSRKFFLQHGGSANLTYLDGRVVLAPSPLESGSDIMIGRTKLRFVALCGLEFDWQDE